jgi:hemerythrin-like domain-containing protein
MRSWTQVLSREHVLIRRAATCLERVVDTSLAQDDVCIVSALDLLQFFEEFSDGTHQEKEERSLFPALLASGSEPERVQSLLTEHREERALLATMREELEGTAYGDGPSRDRFLATARHYARFQREHANAEDRALLPLAVALLTPDAARRVLAEFDAIAAELSPRPAGHYAGLVRRVEARLAASGSSPRGARGLTGPTRIHGAPTAAGSRG